MQREEVSLKDRFLIANRTSINLVKGEQKKDVELLFLFGKKFKKELLTKWGI